MCRKYSLVMLICALYIYNQQQVVSTEEIDALYATNTSKAQGTKVASYAVLDSSVLGKKKPLTVLPSTIATKQYGFLRRLRDANHELFAKIPPDYQIVYPTQIRRGRNVGTSTHNHRGGSHAHYRRTSLQVTIAGRKRVLQLALTQHLVSGDITVNYFKPGRLNVIENIQNCYYQGRIHNERDSFVALSTCHGISGVIYLQGITYIIKPLKKPKSQDANSGQEGDPHIVYKAAHPSSRQCGNSQGKWRSYKELHKGDFLRKMKIINANREAGNGDYEQKFLKVALFVDFDMAWKLNTSQAGVIGHILEAANVMDLFYKELSVRVVVRSIEIWGSGNQISVTSNSRQTIQNFLHYKQKALTDYPQDVGHLISGKQFDRGSGGLAIPDTVCSDRAISVSQGQMGSSYGLGIVMTHMVGHNLGLVHDEQKKKCFCHDNSGCAMGENIMGHGGLFPKRFSMCSRNDLSMALHTGLAKCLLKQPTPEPAFSQYCGNSIIERGEECDCGSQESCAKTDPCCDPTTCTLKYWATCRTGTCCHNCIARGIQHLCRESRTECDVAELCDGFHGECPADDAVQDGTSCGKGQGYCYKGQCPTHQNHCQHLWGLDSRKADLGCFHTFNKEGTTFGHCGKREQNKYRACQTGNELCGLVHCQGGSKDPVIDSTRTYSSTVSLPKSSTHCKTVTGPQKYDNIDIGLAPDGARCGEGRMCLHQQCLDIDTRIRLVTCVEGPNNLTCSGNGVCTNQLRCFCNYGYSGKDCSLRLNVPFRTTQKSTSETTQKPASTTVFNSSALMMEESDEVEPIDTMMIVIILGSVIGALIIVLTLAVCCYRRRSPLSSKSSMHKNGSIISGRSIFGSPKKTGSVKSISSAEDRPGRIIQFGSMPSYRQDKLSDKKSKSKNKRPLKDSDATDSEGTPTSSDETEVKVMPNDLSRVPERGILKLTPKISRHGEVLPNVVMSTDRNCSSSDEHKKELSPSDNEHYLNCDQIPLSPKRGNVITSNLDTEGSPPPLDTPPFMESDASKESFALDTTPVNHLDFSDSDTPTHQRTTCDVHVHKSHLERSNSKSNSSSSLDNFLPNAVPKSLSKESINQDTVSNLSSPSDLKASPKKTLDLPDSQKVGQGQCDDGQKSSKAPEEKFNNDHNVLYIETQKPTSSSGTRIIKLRNIDNLLKSIDKQAQEALSPTNSHNSDENSQRYSEPEVDHHYKQDGSQEAKVSVEGLTNGLNVAQRPKTLHIHPNRSQLRHTPPSNMKQSHNQPSTSSTNENVLAKSPLTFQTDPPYVKSPFHHPQCKIVPVKTIVGPKSKSASSSPVKLAPSLSIFKPITHQGSEQYDIGSHSIGSSSPKSVTSLCSPQRSKWGHRSRSSPYQTSPAHSDLVVYSPPTGNLFRPIHPAKISYEDFEKELGSFSAPKQRAPGKHEKNRHQGGNVKGQMSSGDSRNRRKSSQ